jgi:hypothetical protein
LDVVVVKEELVYGWDVIGGERLWHGFDFQVREIDNYAIRYICGIIDILIIGVNKFR